MKALNVNYTIRFRKKKTYTIRCFHNFNNLTPNTLEFSYLVLKLVMLLITIGMM